MYIIGTDVDKTYDLSIKTPVHVSNTSEFCYDDDLYTINLTVPNTENEKTKNFSIHLYASNSKSNPNVNQEDNYWKHLVPMWTFYDENKKQIYDLPIVVEDPGEKDGIPTLSGIAKFHFVDNMPAVWDDPIFIWATLNIDETTKSTEEIAINGQTYDPPSYANSKIIAVAPTMFSQLHPTSIKITRNAKDSISNGVYWSNQKIPFIATIYSDHYKPFREKYEPGPKIAADFIYDYPATSSVTGEMTGTLGVQYIAPTEKSTVESAIEKYEYFTKEKWDFISTYIPPNSVLQTSGHIPYPINVSETNTIYDILEIMDWPTYDNLKMSYADIPLDEYFIHLCEKCESQYYPYDGPDLNIITLSQYKRLISEHEEFKYVPYALRIADTLTIDNEDGSIKYLYSTLSSYGYEDEEQSETLKFKLFDTRNNYNYKTGGYSLGITTCPDLHGEKRTAVFTANSNINSDLYQSSGFNLYKYAVISDSKYVFVSDERDNRIPGETEIEKYIPNEIVHTFKPLILQDEMEKTVENSKYLIQGGIIGPSCTVQDPLYNIWVADADTGILYKFDPLGELKRAVELKSAIDKYISTHDVGIEQKTRWNDNGSIRVSPTCMALDSKNNLYVTCFDQMLLIKVDGSDGSVTGVWCFPDEIVNDINANEACELGAGWKITGVDTNEIDDVVILLQTRYSTKSARIDSNEYSVDSKLIFFDGKTQKFTAETTTVPNLQNANNIDTTQLVYRSSSNYDCVFFAGSIQTSVLGLECSVWRYRKPKSARNAPTFSVFGTYLQGEYVIYNNILYECTSKHESEPWNPDHFAQVQTKKIFTKYYNETNSKNLSNLNATIDSLHLDSSNDLWFAVTPEQTLPGVTPSKSTLYVIKNAIDGNNSATSITMSGHPGILVGGISQATDTNILILDKTTKTIEECVLQGSTLIPKKTRHVQRPPHVEEDFDLFARGDWTGANFFNKYIKSVSDTLTTIPEDNTITVYSYDQYYIRKHNEEWDVPEHMKIPVAHTSFVEDNPTLFDAIGTIFGIDEHKHYSIGKKLFEGIANQVNNIHDIDECHIDSIYGIAKKEDVNMDKFFLAYPEELRRIVDLMSISKKKLWGDRCHCTQNYFKTKNKDETKFCDKCQHVHTTNLGTSIKRYSDVWSAISYRTEYKYKVIENNWIDLAHAIVLQVAALNFALDIDPKIECKENELLEPLDAVAPVNAMLDEIEKNLYYRFTRLTKESNSYDVLSAIRFINDILFSIPMAYIVEDKYNRNEFTRIDISTKSYTEAQEILSQIEDGSYLTEEDMELVQQNKTNARIILYFSVLNLREEMENESARIPACSNKERIPESEIVAAQLVAIHTSFFVPDQWFNYCYWHFISKSCHDLNTSVINWDSPYNTLPEHDSYIYENWLTDSKETDVTGTMEKILNYILHNGTLFHINNEYIDD